MQSPISRRCSVVTFSIAMHAKFDDAELLGSVNRTRQSSIARRLEIPLPPLAEQRRIAEVLDRAEALRAKRRAALAQLDSLTQSLFLDLFGDPHHESKGHGRQASLQNCADCNQGSSQRVHAS